MSNILVTNRITAEYNRQALYDIIVTLQNRVNQLSDHQFGQITISNSAATIAMTAAVDSTLATNSDYVQVTGVWNAIPNGQNNGITQQTNTFTIGRTGVYQIAFWANVGSSTNNNTIAFRFSVNGVISLVRRPKARVGTAGDKINVSAFGYGKFNAGDVIALVMASEKTANINLEDLVFGANEMKID